VIFSAIWTVNWSIWLEKLLVALCASSIISYGCKWNLILKERLRSSLTILFSFLLQLFMQSFLLSEKLLRLPISLLNVIIVSSNCMLVTEILLFFIMNWIWICNSTKLGLFRDNKLLRDGSLEFVIKNRVNWAFRHKKILLGFVFGRRNGVDFHCSITACMKQFTIILRYVHLRLHLVVGTWTLIKLSLLLSLSCGRRRNHIIFSLLRNNIVHSVVFNIVLA
jgi:hypothetical protein